MGNTTYSKGFYGPNGLLNTPHHWCRYCGSRLSKKWLFKGRICSKHAHTFRRCRLNGYPHIVFKVFHVLPKGKLGADKLDGPYDVSKNKERHYLELFANEKKGRSSQSESSGTSALESADETDVEYKVARIHSMMQIYKESDDEEDDGEEKCVRLYLMEWEGYGIADSSWEPEENLDCGDSVRQFMEQLDDNRMRDCVHKECGIDGYRCYTKPCMMHHFSNRAYDAFFESYNHSIVRQLANCKPSPEAINAIRQKL